MKNNCTIELRTVSGSKEVWLHLLYGGKTRAKYCFTSKKEINDFTNMLKKHKESAFGK